MRHDSRVNLLWGSAGLLAFTGLVSRIAPLFDRDGRLLQQFPTEDGYLMLTIARNIAIGNGMSIADGTIPTNGTQPLTTLVWAACFWLVGGSKEQGVAAILLLQILIGLAASLALFVVAKRCLHSLDHSAAWAGLAAAAWFAAPQGVRHTMNCLETGLYSLVILLILLRLTSSSLREQHGIGWRTWAALGALLGVGFWARNDAVLLCVAVGVTHLAGLLLPNGPGLSRRIAQLTVAAAAATAVAAPWLAYNWWGFGSLMPISGQAQSMHVTFAENLALVPVGLFEHLSMFLPIPSGLEGNRLLVLFCALMVVAAAVLVLLHYRRWHGAERTVASVGLCFALLLALFYGLTFGAGHFVSRYLFALSPFFAIAWVAGVALGVRMAPETARTMSLGVGMLAFLALAAGLNYRLYERGVPHRHFQVVDWVERNVPEDTWVGAIQTGTLGFFHDRTINLDGKVNPEALAARSAQRIPQYVLDREIQYLVDWVGIAGWIQFPELRESFDVIVKDEKRNLAVLARRDATPKPGAPLGATR